MNPKTSTFLSNVVPSDLVQPYVVRSAQHIHDIIRISSQATLVSALQVNRFQRSMHLLKQALPFVTSIVPKWRPAFFHKQTCKLLGVPGSSLLCTMSAETSAAVSHDVAAALCAVRSRVEKAAEAYRQSSDQVELVAVSKTKPLDLLREAYEQGQRHFGENYVQELVQKAPDMPEDVKWHFIGALQSNKAKVLVKVPNLHVVETVDREKTAAALDKAVAAIGREDRLRVMVQVNTSGEESKSGCNPGETVNLASFVEKECEHLELIGLMTIGAPDTSEEPEAFRVLAEERRAVAESLGREAESLKLSMGMSGDFEAAIRMGSDSVRVGSTIFGAREYPNKT